MPDRPGSDIVFVPEGDGAEARRVRRFHAAGRLRFIHAGIYTTDLKSPLEAVVDRNWHAIAAKLFPAAIVSGRSAFEMRPARPVDEGGEKLWPSHLFLTREGARRNVRLPGLTIHVDTGAGPLPGDYPFLGLTMASKQRALLENLAPSRARAGIARTVGQRAVENELEKICQLEGEDHLDHLRDRARELAPALGLGDEFVLLDGIIGAMRRTRTAELKSVRAQARRDRRPYDQHCLARLERLAKHLGEIALPEVADATPQEEARAAASFVEAYFSNFIEGTRFQVDEARRIVFEGEIPKQRPKDGHDILATYAQLVELGPRSASGISYEAFREEIRERHAHLMSSRPENAPGEFKVEANYAGNTVFVAPALVEGTLAAGFGILSRIDHPFARAVFIHFLLTDVHPFADGNGRISRLMMTKELLAAGMSRIVIPTVYREDYLGGLRRLSRDSEPAPLVRGLTFSQRVTAASAASSVDKAIEVWASTYAFHEPGPHARLQMPDPAAVIEWRDGIPAPRDYWEAVAAPSSIGNFRV
jgi:hypothetical protein